MSISSCHAKRLPVFVDLTVLRPYRAWLDEAPRSLQEVLAFWKSEGYEDALESAVLSRLPEAFRKVEVLDHLAVLTDYEWAQVDLILQGQATVDCVRTLQQSLPGAELVRIWELEGDFLLDLRLEQVLYYGLDASCNALLRLARAGLIKEFAAAYNQLSPAIKESLGCVHDFVLECLQMHLPRALNAAKNMDDVRGLLHVAGEWKLETQKLLAASQDVVLKLLASSELCEADRDIPQLFCPALKSELVAYAYRGLFTAFISKTVDEREDFFRWALPRLRNPGSPQAVLTPDELLAKVVTFLKKRAFDMRAVFLQNQRPWTLALQAAGGMNVELAKSLEGSFSALHPEHAKEVASLLAPSWIAAGQQKVLLDAWSSLEWTEALSEALLLHPDLLGVKFRRFEELPYSAHTARPELLWQLLEAGGREAAAALARLIDSRIALLITPANLTRLLRALKRQPVGPAEITYFSNAFEVCARLSMTHAEVYALLESSQFYASLLRDKARLLYIHLRVQHNQGIPCRVDQLRNLIALTFGQPEMTNTTFFGLLALKDLLADEVLPTKWRVHAFAALCDWLRQVDLRGCDRFVASGVIGAFSKFVHTLVCSTENKAGWLDTIPVLDGYHLASICFSVYDKYYEFLFDERAIRSGYMLGSDLEKRAIVIIRLMDYLLQAMCRPPGDSQLELRHQAFLDNTAANHFYSYTILLNQAGQDFIIDLMSGSAHSPAILDLFERALPYYIGKPLSSWPPLIDARVCPTTDYLDLWAKALAVLSSREDPRVVWDDAAIKLSCHLEEVAVLAMVQERYQSDPQLWKGLVAVLAQLLNTLADRDTASQAKIKPILDKARFALFRLTVESLNAQGEDAWLDELDMDADTEMCKLTTAKNPRELCSTDSCLAFVGLDALATLLLSEPELYLRPHPPQYQELGLCYSRAAQAYFMQVGYMFERRAEFLSPYMVPTMMRLMHSLLFNPTFVQESDYVTIDRTYFEHILKLWSWFTKRPPEGNPAGVILSYLYDVDCANPGLGIDKWGMSEPLALYLDAKKVVAKYREEQGLLT